VCARFTLTASGEDLAEAFGLEEAPLWTPRYNIAPSQAVLAVRRVGGRRRADPLRWGLAGAQGDVDEAGEAPGLPGFDRPARGREGPLLINARSETVASRPAFRDAFATRRCLVPADGFFEWKRLGSARQPFRICRPDGRPFAFAGLWQPAPEAPGEPGGACAILTTEPNELVRGIHDRMPVILAPHQFELWLAPGAPRTALAQLLRPAPPGELTAFPVSPRVNRTRNDDPGCLEPASEVTGDPQGRLFD
jgi:putative SOS response-associated peptidase YedK